MSDTMKESKELVAGSVLGKYHCPSCMSNDNLVVYVKHDDNGDEYLDGHCFTPSCDNSFMTEKMLKEQGVLDEDFKAPKVPKVVKTAITYEEYLALTERIKHPDYALTSTVQPDGSLYRGITPETAKFYGHLYERNSDGWIIKTYYPETKTGFMNGKLKSLRGYKTRLLPKNFSTGVIGATGRSNDFSGQSMFKTGGKWVLVVGGEEDKLASAQMLRDYQKQRKQDEYDRIAVVSPTTGEGSLAKQCADNYEWLDTFEEIIIAMDNDEAGHNATQEALRVLPEGKVKVMHLSGEDCSEMLQNGRQKQFISNFYDAKPLIDAGIKSSTDAVAGVRDYLLAEKIQLPPHLHKLQTAMRGGIRSTGSIVNVIGKTSIGKTLFSDTLVYHFIFNSPIRPVIFSIERTAEELLIDLYSMHLQQNLTWFEDGHDAVEYLDQPEVKKLCDEVVVNELGEQRFFVIDERKGNIEALKKQIERAIKQYDSKLIVIDVLSDILRSLPLSEQDDFMLWQKQMKKEGVVFLNVCHTRKEQAGGNKPKDDSGEETFQRVSEYDIHGSGSIPQSADFNIVLNRNKNASDPIEKNTTYIDLPKARGGDTGHNVMELYYDPITRQQVDREDFFANGGNTEF